MKKHFFIFIVIIFLCGCDNSPMGKLKSHKQHPELAKVWHAEMQKNSELWKQAVTFCNANAGSFISYNKNPNCQAVIDEYLLNKINGKLDAHPIDSKF